MSNILFVFATSFELSEALDSLVISQQGDIIEPYQRRELSELKQISAHSHLYWILPSTLVKPYIVSLPTLKRHDATIPFLLEESLVSDLDSLHFVLDKTPVKENHYFVSICHKEKLQALIEKLSSVELSVSLIASDFIRRDTDSIFYTKDYAIISKGTDVASINYTLLTHYENDLNSELDTYVFSDSPQINRSEHCHSINSSYHSYLATEFIKKTPLTLLQGPLKPPSTKHKYLPITSIAVCAIGILAFITNLATQFVMSKQELRSLTMQTTAIYKKFFPNAQAVISPRFRIEQKLKENQGDALSSQFFSLLDKVHHTFKGQTDAHVDHLKYANGEILLQLHTKGFDKLSALKLSLENQQVNVSQLSATSQRAVVNASWRLKS